MAEVRSLLPGELESWFDFVARTFGHSRAYFVRHWEADPHRSLAGILVAVEGGEIRSTLRIFTRQLYLGGQAVPVGGVGEVCTDPAWRGQGLSSQLLAAAIEQMKRRAFALSLLFSSSNPHYARHGWQSVPLHLGVGRVPLSPLPADWRVSPANPRDRAEAAALQALYASFAAARQGAVVRDDPAYWSGWVAGEWKQPFIVRHEGSLVGYLAAHWVGPTELNVEDFAALPELAEQALRCLLAGAARERGLAGELTLRCPVAALPGWEPAERQLVGSPMYRVIRPDLLTPPAAQALDRLLQGEVGDHLIWPSDWF